MNDETNSSGMASLTGPAFERPDLAAFKSDAERAQWIRATVAKMDSPSDPAQCDYTDRNIQLVCFLIGAFLVGDDEQRIARMLGHDPRVQAEWIRNLRQNGLWPPDRSVMSDDWFDPCSGAIGFTLHMQVAKGLIERHIDPVRGPAYTALNARNIHEIN